MTLDPTKIQPRPTASDKTEIVSVNFDAEDNKTRIAPKNRRDAVPTPSRTLEKGAVVKDRFILDTLLGKGGMGTVYRALDLRKKEAGDNKPYVAIKLLGEDFKNHPEALVTLQREARKTQELAHPNIVTVYDFDRDGDLIYITMEELKGTPLADLIRDNIYDFSLKQRLEFLRQIALGLSYAHSKGIVHSDLKPGNIFITEANQVKILDFGIARAANSELYEDTFDAGDLGALTLNYASLEMLQRDKPHPSDDIYALGVIACELLGGSHPYGFQDAEKALEKNTPAKLPTIKNPLLRRLVLNSIAIKRKDRIQNADEFLKKLKFAKSGLKTIGGLVILVAFIAIGNAYYLQKYGNHDIKFKDLPESAQTEFKNHLTEAQTALGFGDLQGAVINIDQAYSIHHTQKDLVKLRDSIVVLLNKNIAEAPDEKTKVFYQEQLQQLKIYPAFADPKESHQK